MQKRVIEIRSGEIVRDAQTASYLEVSAESDFKDNEDTIA
jgi:hypothetical protein